MRESNAFLSKKRLSMSKELKSIFGWLVFRNHINLYFLAFGSGKHIEDFTAFDKLHVGVDLPLQNEQMLVFPLKMVRNA
jgi:hypothetical protein